ncbi:MAG TPA: hypothetical protein ENJ57_06185, partial [Rhizobiales bacterium]|nr:hypothetical protein [Hyphomicrobiales bacterium]
RGEVYLEFVPLGNMVKVSAVDATTGEEVSIAGPRNASRAELERTALAKLRYVQRKNRTER